MLVYFVLGMSAITRSFWAVTRDFSPRAVIRDFSSLWFEKWHCMTVIREVISRVTVCCNYCGDCTGGPHKLCDRVHDNALWKICPMTGANWLTQTKSLVSCLPSHGMNFLKGIVAQIEIIQPERSKQREHTKFQLCFHLVWMAEFFDFILQCRSELSEPKHARLTRLLHARIRV